jgi:hypothetical protein
VKTLSRIHSHPRDTIDLPMLAGSRALSDTHD